MAGSGIRANAGLEVEPNLTPMIDVLLVMIIVWMLALRVRHAIDIQTPAPSPGSIIETAPQIVLELRTGGLFAINGQPVPESALDTTLREIYAGRPAKLLFVKVACNCTYQEVIAAMDRSRGDGVQVIALMPRTAR
jgi:biopolymer transport protein ExbD